MATILLVNRDTVQAWLYQQELQEQGHTVHVATTETQALSLLTAVEPRLIVLDSGPPGSAATHRLAKRLCEATPVPVILNASSMVFDENLCHRHGWHPAARVLKSSDLAPLLSAIRRVLNASATSSNAHP
jgi:CheY-like chemotaxis protein